MAEHLAFILKTSSYGTVYLLKNELQIASRKKSSTVHQTKRATDDDDPLLPPKVTECSLKSLEQETVLVKGKKTVVNRIYVSCPDSGDYGKLGWILSVDVFHCMVCGDKFGCKHHCRGCGIVICSSCSDWAIVDELKDLGKLRVCRLCYWGQVEWHKDSLHRSFIYERMYLFHFHFFLF